MSASIASLTPAQQRQVRIAENTFAGFNPTVPAQVYDAIASVENLVLIENSINIDGEAKKRVMQLREAIKMKIARR